MSDSLLQRLTVVSGDLDGGDSLPGSLGEKSGVLGGALSSAGQGLIRFGGGYAAATGASAVISAAAGLPVVPSAAFAAGACALHGCQRISEGWLWHRRGGRAAERKRRKWQGEASPLDVRRTLSPAAAARKMSRLAPDLPAAQAYVEIGTTVHRPAQKVAVSRAETILLLGVPQTIKTASMSSWILKAPGAVLATSSRGDQFEHTFLAREKLGEVLTLDADGYGPGTSFSWSPIAGCEDPAVAMRRAGDFMHASPRDPGGKDRWHEDRGAKLLRMALHAAALAGGNMLDVRAWIQAPHEEQFLKALQLPGAAAGWGWALTALAAQDEQYLASAVTSAESALGWMDDPALAAVACPLDGEGIDIAAFLRKGTGTVYLIGAARPYGSLTPFFSAFVSEFMEQARFLAEHSPRRKLAVPLTIAADEAATTARIDFERWCAVTAGYNITVMAGFQTLSQLTAQFGGEHSAETIMSMFTTKVIGGGMTSVGELQRLSTVCGRRDTWRRGDGGKVIEQEDIFPPERIRLLPQFNALVIQRNAKPVQVRITPVWDQPGYQPVTITPETPGQPAPAQPPTQE